MMNNGELKSYELFELSNKSISECSYLYSIEPIGKGTAYIESLTSYITRMAVKHNVSTLNFLKREVYKHTSTNIKTAFAGRGFYDNSYQINGMDKYANIFIEVMNSLTKRSELSQLTLNNWVNIFSNRGLLKKNKCYCPLCYQKTQNNNLEVFDPLLFCFSLVEVCPIHKTKLLTNCLYQDCGKTQFYLSSFSLPGYCQHCRRWLGINKDLLYEELDAKLIDSQLWITDQLGSLLCIGQMPNHIIDDAVNLTNIIEKDLMISCYKLSKLINNPYITVKRWYDGLAIPSIGNLMKLCGILNLSLKILLTEDKVKLIDSKKVYYEDQSKQIRKKKVIDKCDLVNKVKLYISDTEENLLSLSNLSMKTQVSIPSLRRICPDLCKEIVERRKAYLKKEIKKKDDELIETIKDIIIMLNSQGRYPSITLVSKYLPSPALFLRKDVYAKWNEMLSKLNIKKAEKM